MSLTNLGFPADAERVIDAIEASGTDDEAEWVRIAGGGEDDEQSASERAQQRAEAMVADELAAYRLAERRLAVARDGLHSALGRAMEAGHTPYRLAQVTGLSQAWIGRLRTRTHSPESRVERQD